MEWVKHSMVATTGEWHCYVSVIYKRNKLDVFNTSDSNDVNSIILLNLGQIFFISWFTNHPTVIFQKVEKEILNFFFLFYPPALNIICFVEKKIEVLFVYFWERHC